MSYLGRKRKPKSKAMKRPQRAPSMQLDHISNEWNIIDRQPASTKVTEHGECQAVWLNEAKYLTLWARFVKWLRGWHG